MLGLLVVGYFGWVLWVIVGFNSAVIVVRHSVCLGSLWFVGCVGICCCWYLLLWVCGFVGSCFVVAINSVALYNSCLNSLVGFAGYAA